MRFNIKNKIGARFKLIAHKGDGIPIRESEWFNNIVLNAGLARMSVGSWANRCCVGTGSSEPAPTQTTLDSFQASTTTRLSGSEESVANTSTAPHYFGSKITWRFGQGVASGNISEVGLGWSNSHLWNRALIKDANGNPVTITVLSDEYLDVVSEVRVYPTEAASGSFNLLNKLEDIVSTHTYTGKPVFPSSGAWSEEAIVGYQLNFYSGRIENVGITENPTGPQGNVSYSSAANTYPTPTTCKTKFTIPLASLNTNHRTLQVKYSLPMAYNVSGNTMGGYVFEIDPPIAKNNTQTMTYTFEISWGRYEPT